MCWVSSPDTFVRQRICVGACSWCSHRISHQESVGGRADIGNLASHLTNTCHLKRQAPQQQGGSGPGEVQEEAAVKLLSELPQVMPADPGCCQPVVPRTFTSLLGCLATHP